MATLHHAVLAADERLVHPVLIPQHREDVGLGRVDVPAELGLAAPLPFLLLADHRLVRGELLVTLGCLLLELVSARADFHVVVTFLECAEAVTDIILAVHGGWHPNILDTVDSFLFVAVLAINFVLDELLAIAEQMRIVKLAMIDCLALAVAAPGDVPLPLIEGHELVVAVEWTDEDLVAHFEFN